MSTREKQNILENKLYNKISFTLVLSKAMIQVGFMMKKHITYVYKSFFTAICGSRSNSVWLSQSAKKN